MGRTDDVSLALARCRKDEHRAVVNGTYELLYGGYWYRIYGLWYALLHIFGFVFRESNAMIRHDLATGQIVGKWRSRARYAQSLGRLFGYAMPRLLFVCHRPSYDPKNYPPMEGAVRFLDQVSRRYNVVESGQGESPPS